MWPPTFPKLSHHEGLQMNWETKPNFLTSTLVERSVRLVTKVQKKASIFTWCSSMASACSAACPRFHPQKQSRASSSYLLGTGWDLVPPPLVNCEFPSDRKPWVMHCEIAHQTPPMPSHSHCLIYFQYYGFLKCHKAGVQLKLSLWQHLFRMGLWKKSPRVFEQHLARQLQPPLFDAEPFAAN